LDSVRVAAAMCGEEAAMGCARAWEVGSDLGANKGLEGIGRDGVVFILLSRVLPTSVAKPFFFPFVLFRGPPPAACALVGVALGG